MLEQEAEDEQIHLVAYNWGEFVMVFMDYLTKCVEQRVKQLSETIARLLVNPYCVSQGTC